MSVLKARAEERGGMGGAVGVLRRDEGGVDEWVERDGSGGASAG